MYTRRQDEIQPGKFAYSHANDNHTANHERHDSFRDNIGSEHFPPEDYSGTFINNNHSESKNIVHSDNNCFPDDYEPHESSCRSPSREKSSEKGLLGGLFGRLGNIELDDLIIIGLVLLLINNHGDECESGDDLLLILAVLFFLGQ